MLRPRHGLRNASPQQVADACDQHRGERRPTLEAGPHALQPARGEVSARPARRAARGDVAGSHGALEREATWVADEVERLRRCTRMHGIRIVLHAAGVASTRIPDAAMPSPIA
jgi:hypothetical protein